MLRFTSLLSSDWQLGDEIVLSRLDADYVMRPWLQEARDRGAVVRWAEVDLETGELPAWQYESLIGRRTRVVTIPLANAATGIVPDVRAIADLAHHHGAVVVVDAGVAPAYVPLDLTQLGADLLAVAAPAFGGPTVAALIARPGLLDEIPGGSEELPVPQRFEVPPLPIELLDGFTAAVDHLADLDERATGPRRERLVASITGAGAYARHLYPRLDDGLRAIRGVTVLGAPHRHLPVAAFTVAGRTPDQVGAFLHRHNISAWTGPSGVSELLRAFGADELGGAVFVGLMPHTAAGEVDQLLEALRAFTA
jgi:selenocysteine lyase/cysteine desulfurase